MGNKYLVMKMMDDPGDEIIDNNTINVLFIGDIVGKSGRAAASNYIPQLFEEYSIDFCIANAENAAGGFGLTPEVADQLFLMKIDVLTSGNHIWDKKEIIPYLEQNRFLIRPANYPPETPGRGYCIVNPENGPAIGVLNLYGRVFGSTVDCPFRKGKSVISRILKTTPIVIVDFHGEATSEKTAFGWHVDGLASAVIGTHTHIQTADERILPAGTAYISDAGMVGAYNSVIGTKPQDSIKRFLTQRPSRLKVAGGPNLFNGCVISIDKSSGNARKIIRICNKPTSESS